MIYDVPFRHQQALDPSALTTLHTTLHAIEKAIVDCRNAGVHPDTDPAVVLLVRHLVGVSTNRAPDAVLQAACSRRIEELRRFPTLLALAIRGVEYDPTAKERFHHDGRKALRRLAAALALADGSFTVRSDEGGVWTAGDVLLRAPGLTVSLSIGGARLGREVAYRRTGGTDDFAQPRYATIAELLKPERFAERVRRDLAQTSPIEMPANTLLPA